MLPQAKSTVSESPKIIRNVAMERIGFAGLGRMGQAMAGRLLAGGFPLVVYNRTRPKADELLAQGAAWADTPSALVEQADIILTILPDDRAVEQGYSGPRRRLPGDCAGQLFVAISTNCPASV